MHEFGKFLQSLMDSENMKPADLARRSGLSRQLVWNLLSDAEMKTIPKVETLSGLRKAFPAVPYTTWVLRAAASAGIPVEEEPFVDYSALSNEALLGILHERLTGGSNGASAAEAEKRTIRSLGDHRRNKMIADAQPVQQAAAPEDPEDEE